jgi:DNA repair exonuclease SbcCD ATPase subunit
MVDMIKMDRESINSYLREGWKPYYHKTVGRWYLRKGQKRKIVPKELEDIVSKIRPPISKLFVDAQYYNQLQSIFEKVRTGDLDVGSCPTCGESVKLKDAQKHMGHVKVEKVVERVVERPEQELKGLKAELDEVKRERDGLLMEKLELEKKLEKVRGLELELTWLRRERDDLRERLKGMESVQSELEELKRRFDYRVREQSLEALKALESKLEGEEIMDVLKGVLKKAVDGPGIHVLYTSSSWYPETARRIASAIREIVEKERLDRMGPVEHE